MNLVKRKKLKYGSLAIGLTVAVVAFIIILNAVFSALSNHFFWYFDMTSGQIYQLSDNTTKYLDQISGEENDITIYFLTDKDNLNMPVSSSNSISESTLWGMKPIHELALQLDDKYDFISVDYIDLTSEPDKIKSIVGEDAYVTTSFATSYILIVNNTYERNSDGSIINGADGNPIKLTNYKICARSSFYLYDYSTGYVNAFRGDYYFAATLMSLTKVNKPNVYFLSGHGESVGDAGDDTVSSYGNAVALYYLFEEAGCNVRKINLQYDDFDANEENAIVVVYGPKRDITSSSTTTGTNETDKLAAFLEGKGNSMLFFFDSRAVQLTNFEALVKAYCGVTISDSVAKDSGESSVSHDGYSIVGKYQTDSSSIAHKVTDRLASAGMANKVIFTDALPITVSDNSKTDAVMLLPKSAYSEEFGDSAALMTMTSVDNGGKIFVCGSTDFANNIILESDVYSNKNLLFSVLYEMNVGEVPMNIEMKIVRSEGLDRTEQEARAWTLAVSVAMPLVVAIIGTVVYVRRKHS
ncbi:MAG: Gldg family protein [Clostridia bacterium]|nr:Gldg family protein [Clostridia bacterium]MBR3714848.1 Gldg family protein [Clostridia bacterium]